MSKKQTEDNPDLSKKQDIPVIITPLYPFRQGQKNALNGIIVPRREWDEYQYLIKKAHITQKEQKRFNQLNDKWAYRDQLTGKEIILIEQTVGSVYMSEIRAFFIKRYQYTPDELNRLTCYDILDILRGFKRLRSTKNMQADPANKQPPKLPPLSIEHRAVLDIIESLPPNTGIQAGKLVERLETEKHINIDESTFRKSVYPALKPYGVKNQRKGSVGYYKSTQ